MEPISYPEASPASPPKAPKQELPSAAAVAEKVKNMVGKSGEMDEFKEQLIELQSWDKPMESATVVAGATTLYYMTSGADGYSLATLVCYLVIVRLAAFALLNGVNERMKDAKGGNSLKPVTDAMASVVSNTLVIPTSSQLSKAVRGFAGLVETGLTKLCDKVAIATEPTEEGKKALKSLFPKFLGVALLLRFFSSWTLLYFYVLFQMLWPKFYTSNQEKVDKAYATVSAKAEPHVEKLREHGSKLLTQAEEKGFALLKTFLEVVGSKVHEFAEKIKAKLQKPADGEAVKAEKAE